MIIWTNFDSFAMTYLMQVARINNFPIEVCLILCKHERAWNEFSGRSFRKKISIMFCLL